MRRAATGRARRPALALAAWLGVALAPGAPLLAAPPCPLPTRLTPPRAWAPPLDRLVTVEAGSLSLRDGLDRVAAAAGFRLSYSADALPLDRGVCLAARRLPAGDALLLLLDGTGVEPLIVSPAQVVLPPPPPAPDVPLAAAPVELASIIVTGSVSGQERRPLTLALDIVSGADLRHPGDGSLAASLSGAVPGLWLWPETPGTVLASYASIRGASSFGLSYPKVYIDGIELANPLLLTGLAPETVDRIEFIRGPQGATLYGADAISGVMNIVTRQQGGDPAAGRFALESGVRVAGTSYGDSPALGQRHAFSARYGSNLTAGALHLAAGTDGPHVPGAGWRSLASHATLRHVASSWILTGLARVSAQEADNAPSPLLPDSGVLPGRVGAGATQSVLGYTIGANARFLPSDRWTHRAVVGLDGYRLNGVADERTPITSAADSALRAAEGGAVRGTLRLSTVRHLSPAAATRADLTLTAEHSILRQWASLDSTPRRTPSTAATRHTSGASAVTSVALAQRLYLSGGLRVEGTTGNDPVVIPMAGVAVVAGGPSLSVKLRGAYGKGVRWPTGTVRTAFSGGGRGVLSTAGLDPEEQSGLEAGVDIALGPRFSASVTRFDQVASGLIQRVGSADSSGGPGGGPRVVYSLENVGEITNRGWEIGASAATGPLRLSAAWATVDSRVRRLAPRYGGDLQEGDRMLEVPRHTLHATARVRSGRWIGAASVTRALDWVNYDRRQIAADFTAGRPARDFVGQRLRAYWRTYHGVTRLRLSASRSLGRHFTAVVAGDNLLDAQRGEPDNLTVVPGRTLSIALRGAW